MKQELIDQDMIIFEDEDENKQTFRNTTTTSNQDMLQKQLEQNQEKDLGQDILVGGCIKAKEFEEIAEVYDQIRQWNEDLEMKSSVDDYQLAMMFDHELKNVMQSINNIQNNMSDILDDQNRPELKHLETKQRCIECLQQLFQLCQQSIIDILQSP